MMQQEMQESMMQQENKQFLQLTSSSSLLLDGTPTTMSGSSTSVTPKGESGAGEMIVDDNRASMSEEFRSLLMDLEREFCLLRVDLKNKRSNVDILKDLILQQGDADDDSRALLMVDIQRVATQYDRWQRHLSRVTPYYAVKCNPDMVLLRALSALGCHFDCASAAEMGRVMDVRKGKCGWDIVYSNPCKQISGLKFARDNNIKRMVFDNEDELYKIRKHFPDAQLLLRIRTDDEGAVCPLSCKFGAARADWRGLLRVAKQLDLSVVGVAFHVGSGCRDNGAFALALKDAHELFHLALSEGFAFSVLDIGGGFPGGEELLMTEQSNSHHHLEEDADDDDTSISLVVTPTPKKSITFQDMAKEISTSLDELFPQDLEVFAEPGRYFACSSHTLAVRIFARRAPSKNTSDANDAYLYYVNDGLYGSFNNLLYDHATVEPFILRRTRFEDETTTNLSTVNIQAETTYRSTVFGPTCDGFDVILKDHRLPRLEVDDWLVFKNMGAYTTAAGSTFNGFEKPRPIYCCIR